MAPSDSILVALLSACSPLVLRLFSAFKPNNNRTTNEQQLNNYASLRLLDGDTIKRASQRYRRDETN